MIDPDNITRYDLTNEQLEEHLLFWLMVAGKTAATISRSLESIFHELSGGRRSSRGRKPFAMFRAVGEKCLPELLKRHGVGCYNVKGKGIWQLVNSNINLRTCNSKDLQAFNGIGRKTAKCFILHSRKDAQEAGLDTHVLKYLSDMGYQGVPIASPSSDKVYEKWERVFLKMAKNAGMTPANFDLKIWRAYAGREGDKTEDAIRYLRSIKNRRL